MVSILFCSFQERILIKDKPTRQCLLDFAKQKFSDAQYAELICLIETHALKLEPLICHLYENFDRTPGYREKWRKFLCSVASVSPACTLIAPTPVAQQLISQILTDAA